MFPLILLELAVLPYILFHEERNNYYVVGDHHVLYVF
jgi:hypothetical protein